VEDGLVRIGRDHAEIDGAAALHQQVPPALELREIRKTFDGFVALDGTHFSAWRGEVHGLLGENGAGKSSLMNVAAGLYLPEAGRVLVQGIERTFSGPLAAAACGIGMVHQHYKLVKSLSVAENVLLAARVRGYRRGLRTIEKAILQHAESLGFDIDPRRLVRSLSIAEQQRVEIVKALVAGAEILILDEPTAVLTDEEATRLLRTMRTLASSGTTVILVTHKLRDVRDFADRVTVMRAGRSVAVCDPRRVSTAELTELIVGATTPLLSRQPAERAGVRLAIAGLHCARGDGHVAVSDVSLAVRSGEIYGLAGVGGNGQTELVEAVLGVRPPLSGRIEVDGAGDIAQLPPGRRRDLRVAAIPADRYTYALAGGLSIVDNYAVSRLHTGRFGSWAWVDFARMRAAARAAVQEFGVQGVRRLDQKASLLSGGNAQKLVIAREFADAPRLVIAHTPSRGLDVRSASDVHRRLMEARAGGAAVLLVSEDLEEILSLADRIGVINRGRIVAEFDAPADRQQVGQAMVGHA
jgi:ABC-type uncharacterized transport system ATPase subunit